MAPRTPGGVGLTGALRRLISAWAILGGLLLMLVVTLNMVSIIGSIFGAPFPGDFEMTEVGVAVAAFSFLPYCQLIRANVSADIFTSRASPRLVAIFTLLGSLVALGFALILIWRMYLGLLDQKAFQYTTAILQFPHWLAFVPVLISLAFLALAALITLQEDLGAVRKGASHV
ncbi:MAG: TRAP transporter small permease [Pseudomonadota bacterium]